MTGPVAMTPEPADERPVGEDDLVAPFYEAETPRGAWRIGAESEKFGVDARSLSPFPYEGERSIRRLFDAMVERDGWTAVTETAGGPVVALRRGEAALTLEPGAQLELSGAPLETLHEVRAEVGAHLKDLRARSVELEVSWLAVGFHPLARLDELPWVPKQRYSIMRRFLPTRGARALDMMQRTTTVQANFDYASERDALDKLRLCLRLSPVVHAMTANSPFIEGRVGSRKSERGDVWLHMDPSRSGLIGALWDRAEAGYRDYVDWALDAPMFLIRRGETVIENTGQTFRSFMEEGCAGHRACMGDWKMHLNSLFPEARLKNTIEVRACDSLPERWMIAVPALWTGLLYDAEAFDRAWELVEGLDHATVEAARPRMVAEGLAAPLGSWRLQEMAEALLDIAAAGLERRARRDAEGYDERLHLRPLEALVSRGRVPADELCEGLDRVPEGELRAELVRRSEV